MNKTVRTNIFLVIIFSVILPIVFGKLLNTYLPFTFKSIPIHSVLEASGGIIAIVISLIFYIKYRNASIITHFNWSTTALLAMGIIDIFHASVMPGELFVWLHSISVFFGGIFFVSVWFKDRHVPRLIYSFIPVLFVIFSLTISITSIILPDIIPQMLNQDKTFTTTANMLNIIGGVGFFIASLRFILNYVQTENTEELLFAGHTMLFGIAGVLFVSSVVWDMQWWLWHVLRFSAYVIAFYFLYREYYKEIKDIAQANKDLLVKTDELSQNIAYTESFNNAANEGNIISKSDLQGNIIYVNDNFCNTTGYTRDEVLGKPHNIVRHPDTDKNIFKNMWDTLKKGDSWIGILKNRKKDNGYYWVNMNINPILDKDGNIYEYIAIRHDITELIEQRENLEKIIRTDSLTGLGNRFKLIEDISMYDSPSLSLLNIDNFREINDFYGHVFGDKVIIEFGNKLNDFLKQHTNKTLYRIHADEFAILDRGNNHQTFKERIDQIVNDISTCNCSIESEEVSLQLTATISFETNKANLFTTADMMMKIAKKDHKKLLLYDESLSLDKEYENNIKWTKKLRLAVANDKLVPFYQPIVNNNNGKFEKYECLVRMIDEDDKVISPFFFLDIAKRTKHYLELTKTMINKSFDTFKYIDAEFSINLTIQDIMDSELKYFIYEKLENSDLAKRLVFEIVESEGIENFEKVIDFIEKVKSHGCKIAIDDFGTGYSNFEYLLQLKADYIKIDGSMIKDLDANEDAKAVVSIIIDFAKKMNMKTIAEFVENETINNIVIDMGIDYSQGYHFGAPQSEPSIKE